MTQLMCPVCRASLQQEGKTWRCQNNHSYDQAKQGYVNLHVVQHKHSKSPGDTEDSVAARRRFLAGGFYQTLQQKIVTVVEGLSITRAIDIGCGEGYYTQAMAGVLPDVVAVDIAKAAVQMAAKNDVEKRITWVVGTGAVLPVLDASIELCTSFFSPLPKPEMLRVLKDKGYLLVATPAPLHLAAMRERLFEEVKPHEPEKFIAQMQPEFSLLEAFEVSDTFTLNQQELKDLVAMTPYAYKAKAHKRAELEALETFAVTAAFSLYLFQKV